MHWWSILMSIALMPVLTLKRKVLFTAEIDRLPETTPTTPVDFRFAEEADLETLLRAGHDYAGEANQLAHERLATRDRLVLGEHDGQILFSGWLMFDTMELGYRQYIPTLPDTVYSYKLFTRPDARGHKIATRFYGFLKPTLLAMRYRRIVCWINWTNRPSIRLHQQLGFQPIGSAYEIRLLGHSLFWLSREVCAELPSAYRRRLVFHTLPPILLDYRRPPDLGDVEKTMAPPRPARPSAPLPVSVEVATTPRELLKHVKAWEALLEHVLESNVFYEPWMLVPAFQTFAQGLDVRVLFIYQRNADRPEDESVLLGVFPVELTRSEPTIPIRMARLWQHKYSYLCTPLVRATHAREAFDAFFDYAAATLRCPVVDWDLVPADGPSYRLLFDILHARGSATFVRARHTRALFRPRQDAETYLQGSIKGHHRRKLRRLERQLAEQAPLEYRFLSAEDSLEEWVNAFMNMELSSWKGRDGTAMACREADRAYFQTITRKAFRRQTLLMLGLYSCGKPIAFNCYFRTGRGAYFFKPTFDDSFARFSPGRLLEVEMIRRLHGLPGLDWVDSCTSPDNELLNSIWQDRLPIATLFISTGRAPGDFIVSSLPLGRWLSRKFRRPKTSKPRSNATASPDAE